MPWRGCLGAIAVLLGSGYCIYGGGSYQHPGEVVGARVDPTGRAQRQQPVAPSGARQILFGDLHVHTTYSGDAFMRSLPLMGGEGTHPPADACDYARYCSGLDFFAITDHAEGLTPRHWRDTKESIRRCNEIAGDPSDPDLVAFTGFEWSQVGATPDTHYGHKNVIFRDTDEEHLPVRPIASGGIGASATRSTTGNQWMLPLVPILDFPERQRYLDLYHWVRSNQELAACPQGIDTRELPEECRETADTPVELFEKLDQWGHAALVIPHGTSWGFYTPPGYTWDKQLSPEMSDDRQRLIEVFSGHGNSEEYRAWRHIGIDAQGEPTCPEPTSDFEPCCWRAGEIIRSRCEAEHSDDCDSRAQQARHNYVNAGVGGHLTLPGTDVAEWGNCGQCTDCFDPPFNQRPGGSAQYILARGHFEPGQPPEHATFGFIASSDNHSSRPGTGYKDYARRRMTEVSGFRSRQWRDRLFGEPPSPRAESTHLSRNELMALPGFRVVYLERQASFFMTGGLVAVHADGRSRDGIWDALQERRVYGTSGDRILLWFDLDDALGQSAMGSEVSRGTPPLFRVRAAGSFEQLPGCPPDAATALGDERLANLCVGECYNPSDARRRITRVEVVRIRLQQSEDEEVATLIDDPWLTLPCPSGSDVCEVTFDDPEFTRARRDIAYYVRAIQEPSPAINAGGLRCDEHGECSPCYGDWRTEFSDDCLSDNEERAWSSPIWVRWDETLRALDAGAADGGAP